MPRTATALITLLILVLAGCHGFFQKPVLQSITISPATGAVNATTQLIATGSYDDGSTGTISSGLTWSSSTTSVATIDPNSGVLTGVSSGTTTITVTNGAGGVTGTITFTVTNGTLTSISVSCSPSSIIASVATSTQTSNCTATGNYSGGQTGVNITNSVTWTIVSTGTGVTIGSSTGVVSVPAGTVSQVINVTGASNSIQGSATITVQ